MSRNYREMDSKIENVMQETPKSLLSDIKMYEEIVNKIAIEKTKDNTSILAFMVFQLLKNLTTRVWSLHYMQKESLHNFVWTQEQIEYINKKLEKLNPEETKEIKSTLMEMRNKFESTLGTLDTRLGKINQQEEETKKKMKDMPFYG